MSGNAMPGSITREKPRKRRRRKISLVEESETDQECVTPYGDADLGVETMKRIDYVLVYSVKYLDEIHDTKEREEFKKKLEQRERFERALENEGFETQEETIGEEVFVKIHTPFQRLCKEAESINLEMPLAGCENYIDGPPTFNCCTNFEDKYFVTDDEVDFVSARFMVEKMHIYENFDNPDLFFRPAVRCFLTHHILIEMDIRNISDREKEEEPMARKGLPYLLHKKVYKDAFIMHDQAKEDPAEKQEREEKEAELGEEKGNLAGSEVDLNQTDTRRELHNTWTRFFKFQPLWKIRNYYGEKIALYFAWAGAMISSLWIPTLFGLAVFGYGLYLSIKRQLDNEDLKPADNATLVDKVKAGVEGSISVIKEAFDNDITPWYALVICLWGTIFLEAWKRKNATLAYEWDVDNFENTEVDRPQFYGVKTKPDPVTKEPQWYYPLKRQVAKYMISASMLIVMVLMVFISAAAVILYRVIMSIDYCTTISDVECLILTTVLSSVLNAVSIMILGQIYNRIAVKLTDWENHRTQTEHDDALILKLFAFQFANSYTSLFYIAFFRGNSGPDGLFGLGQEYQDSCGTDNNCMSMLSFQVLTLMILKPFPKFAKDVIIPLGLRLWRRRRCCRKKNVQDPEKKIEINTFLIRERNKPDLMDFTLGEYTEKVINYGFLMLFAASFPLAPLIALLVLLCDIRVDARRLIWMNRRPVALIAQDIGMWYGILQFLNICGVISNAFLIAFTSTWGSKYDLTTKLWIVIGFEHGVFLFKWLVATIIPDVPRGIVLVMRRNGAFGLMWFLDMLIPDIPSKIDLVIKRHGCIAIKFLLKWIVPDIPGKVDLATRRHGVFALKFLLAILIPDVPANIDLNQKREKFQVAKILELAGQKKGGDPNLCVGGATVGSSKTDEPNHHHDRPRRRSTKSTMPYPNPYDEPEANVFDDNEVMVPKEKPKKKKKKRKSQPNDSLDDDDLYGENYGQAEDGVPADGDKSYKLQPLRAKLTLPAQFGAKQSSLSYDENGETYLGKPAKFIDVGRRSNDEQLYPSLDDQELSTPSAMDYNEENKYGQY